MRVADLELRPATIDDAAAVANIETALFPDDPRDPKLERHWWTVVEPTELTERMIALHAGKIAGYTFRRHPTWEKMPERFGRISAELGPAVRSPERIDALYAHLEDVSRADGTRQVTTWSWEDDGLRTGVLTARGFREERRERFWELDLVAERERITTMAAESRARMQREGIRILTLDEDTDPQKFEKLKRMSDEAEADVPTTVPNVPLEMDQFMKWFASPALRPDRIWIARDGDDIVGISMLAYPPVRGFVATDWTGMARRARGRGIARALKCETLMQAIELGVDRVRTDNDSTNAPILHINETMGYKRRHDMVQFLKPL